MAISSSVAAKVGVAGTITAGGGGLVGTYLAWDRITLYEVERKVINEEVEFEITSHTDGITSGNKAWKIATKGEDWGNGKTYLWSCVVIVKDGVSIEEDLKIILNKATGSTQDIKRRLVQACSKDRTADSNVAASNQKVSSKIALSKDTTSDTWIKDLLGTEILNETEKAILKDDSHVFFGTVSTNSSKFPLTVTAKVGDGDEAGWTTKGYSWKCVISGPTSDTTTLVAKIPSDKNGIDNKKLDRKKLVYACAKDRKTSRKSVEASLKLPTTDETTHLFGK